MLPAAARLRHRLVLGTWDGMILPLPFGRGAIVCLPPIAATRATRARDHDSLSQALTAAAARAEALCK
jgi:lysophospholipid acyltransferase (LPLAT)-like uncharacterized protein